MKYLTLVFIFAASHLKLMILAIYSLIYFLISLREAIVSIDARHIGTQNAFHFSTGHFVVASSAFY